MAWKPTYATADEFKSFLRVDVDDPTDDVEIDLALEAASRAVDDCCHRQFGKVAAPEVRYFTPTWRTRISRYVVDVDDVQTLAGMAIDTDSGGDLTFATEVTVADCTFAPLNATAQGRPWTQVILPSGTRVVPMEGTVRVEATWGWTSVPDTIKQATLVQANRFLKRRDSAFGVAGSPDMGNELRLLAKADPDVAVMLRDFTRAWWGA